MIAALTMQLRLLRWFLRRTFWNGIALFKAALNKPLVIPVPQDGNPKIEPVPMDQVVPGLKMPRVLAALQPDIPADERQFANPDVLDITREPNKHLAFGQGAHYCLGSPLARMEGQIAIGTLIERLPALRLVRQPAELRWNKGLFVRGLTQLPLAF